MVSAGQTATATVTVTESNIAKTMKSGSLILKHLTALVSLVEELMNDLLLITKNSWLK